MTDQKTSLVVLYNHNFEKNIPIIRRMYQGRFRRVIQIMPYYSGTETDVIRVFGNSYQFHGFIAQARALLLSMDCDRFLFIGDDLVLNPSVCESTLDETMALTPSNCFYPAMHNVSRGEYYRGSSEAHNFVLHPPGIDASVFEAHPFG